MHKNNSKFKIKDSRWSALPTWKKRLLGFGSYLIFAFTSLVAPVETDKAVFGSLSEQFEPLPDIRCRKHLATFENGCPECHREQSYVPRAQIFA